jgi:hypothetical protein
LALSFIGASTGTTNGSTSTACTYPAGLQNRDYLVLHTSTKYVQPATPSGWTLIRAVSGGSGASGDDSGQAVCSLYYKLATGTELPTQSVTVTVTGGNSATSRMIAVRSTTGNQYEFSSGGGSDNNAGTAWSAVTTTTIETVANDFFFAASAINTDTPNYTVWTLAQSSITFGARTQQYSVGTTAGNDVKAVGVTCSVSSGSGTGAVTYTMTASSGTPAGATIILRLREKARRVYVN